MANLKVPYVAFDLIEDVPVVEAISFVLKILSVLAFCKRKYPGLAIAETAMQAISSNAKVNVFIN